MSQKQTKVTKKTDPLVDPSQKYNYCNSYFTNCTVVLIRQFRPIFSRQQRKQKSTKQARAVSSLRSLRFLLLKFAAADEFGDLLYHLARGLLDFRRQCCPEIEIAAANAE
jgi:hypothetical protein